MPNDEVAIQVENVSKKFCRSLKRSMIYGLQDIAEAAFIPRRFRSRYFNARISERRREASANHTAVMRKTVPVVLDNPGISKFANQKRLHTTHDELPPLRKDEFWALRDISFRVKRGELVGLVGVNGAGKSTLFSILSNIYAPTLGRVRIDGRLRALIALGAGFHPSLSGRENIYINAAILGMGTKDIDRKIEEIIDFSDIRDFIEAPVRTYSSGMLVRLGFAIAVQMNPDILLLDEVLSVGDGSFQAKSLKRAKELTESGCTVVLVSHNLLRIRAFSERCIWLKDAQIWQDGPTSEVLPQYDVFLARRYGRSVVGNVTCLRRGLGLVSIESYGVIDEGGNSLPVPPGGGLSEISMGEDLRVSLSYLVKDGNCGRLRFHVFIKEPDSGLYITSARSKLMERIFRSGHRGTVEVVFPKLRLREGEYCLYLAIDDDRLSGTNAHAVVDEISPSFRVVPSAQSFKNPRGSTRDALVDLPYEFVCLT